MTIHERIKKIYESYRYQHLLKCQNGFNISISAYDDFNRYSGTAIDHANRWHICVWDSDGKNLYPGMIELNLVEN